MRKKLLIGAISLLSLILLLIVGVFVYIRSGHLDNYLRDQIVTALADVGVTAEIGRTHLDIRGYKVTLEDIKLSAANGEQRFGTIERLTAEFSVISYLKQRINITQVEIEHPSVWIEIDKQGGLNLSSLHAPEKKEETKEEGIRFLTSNFVVKDFEIHFVDLQNNTTFEANNLNIHLVPLTPESVEDELNHRLEMGLKGASATFEGRAVRDININLKAQVTDHNAEILMDDNKQPLFEIGSSLGSIKLKGKVESFKPFKYEFPEVRASAKLAEVAQVFSPSTRMNGDVEFAGSFAGVGADYKADGSIQAKAVSAAGFRVSSVNVKTNVTGKGDEYEGRATLTAPELTGPGLSITSIKFSDGKINGKELNFDVTGALNLAALKTGEVSIKELKGTLSVDPDKAKLNRFSAETLGGTVTGSATVAYAGGSSSVDVEFKSIDLNQAATLASAKEVKVRGTANGSAQLKFPRFDIRAATGRINATFDAAVSPAEGTETEAPGKGEINLIANGRGGFTIERANVRSNQSELTVTGSVDWDGRGSLNVGFKSGDMAEVQRVIDAFGAIPESVKQDYELNLEGSGEFVGRVEGKLSAPSITGHLKLDSIKSHNEETGSLEGDIAYSPDLVRVENAAVVRPDGSRADFSLLAPLPVKDNVTVKANVQNFDLAAIAQVALPGGRDSVLASMFNKGVVNGNVDLKGLPGPRTIEGTAKLQLAAVEITPPNAEEGQEPKKISVPEFNGDITIANSVINVQNLKMRIGDSDIAGQGSYNLDTYEYSINAEGKNVDLAQLSDAADTVHVTGKADLKIVGQGQWGKAEDWSNVHVNATIQGHNVMVEGREFGDAKLVAFTEGGILKVQASARLLDQDRTLEATIDLRDRDNYPINAAIEFTDADIGPYLSLIAPELAEIKGTASGTIKLSGPLQDTDRIQAVATLTKLEFGGAITERQTYKIVNQGNIVLTATPREVTLNRVMFTGDGTSVTVEGTLAREAAKSNLTINGEIDLRLLSSFTTTVFTTGIAEVRASIVGKLDSPQLIGIANLRDTGVRILDFPISLAHGNGQIRFTSNQAVIENFVGATAGGGTISISGGAALSGLVPVQWRLEARADQVGAEYPKDTQTVFDAQITLEGNRRLQVLSGNAEIRRASFTKEVTFDELITGGGPFQSDFLDAGPGGSGGPSALATVLDIHITADNTLIIKNNLADALGSAYLNIRGSIDVPQVSGRILLTRGTLNFRNGRYELTRGLITIPGRRGADPFIDVQSETDIRGYHISIGFNGTVSKLQTIVRSEPELPESDIVSLILTGNISTNRSTEAATTQTGLGLAQSILSASLLEKVTQGKQRLYGLNIAIDPLLVGRGNDPTGRVTIGQRVTKDLTVTFSQNLTSGVGGIDRVILVEYRLSNRFSVVGVRNERGELGFDIRLRKKF
jgi:translocation and assembly module TamB